MQTERFAKKANVNIKAGKTRSPLGCDWRRNQGGIMLQTMMDAVALRRHPQWPRGLSLR